MVIIGIDPGVTGAIAFINDPGASLVQDMPIMAADKKGKRNQINAAELYNMLGAAPGNAVVYLEKTHAMPKNGAIASYSQGDSNGCIRAVCACLGLRVERVTPQAWKKHYGFSSDKEVVRAKAIELFPEASLSRKKDHNRAEALLIAEYGKIKGLKDESP